MSPRAATLGTSLRQELEPLIAREISGITAIDTAIAHVASPDYVVMFQGARSGKQANVEQMATLVRMNGESPDESAGLRRTLTRTQAAISSRLSITMALRTMRVGEIDLVTMYSAALDRSNGIVKRALTRMLARALVHTHLLTAHLAKRSGSKADVTLLPAPLGAYFAGPEAHACMRCHLDRPGSAGPLERHDPHPYTYICAACHDEVPGEFPPDLAMQMDHWPREVREAKVIQHALGRVSKLNAIGRVLHPLAGLEPDLPTPAAERALVVPAMTPTPGPAPGERTGEVEIDMTEGPEADYVRTLFSPGQVRHNW